MNAPVCGIEPILGKEEEGNQMLKIKNRKHSIRVGLQLLYVSSAGLLMIRHCIITMRQIKG